MVIRLILAWQVMTVGNIESESFFDVESPHAIACPFPHAFLRYGQQLDEAHVGLMRETPATVAPESLRSEVTEQGYVLLRGLLDPAKVLAARRRVLEQLAEAGQLDPQAPLMEGKFKPGADIYYFRPELAQRNNAELQDLLYAPDGEMMQFFTRLLGGQVLHYDFTWLRCITNGPATPSHCDIVYMGRGTQNLFTAWVPLGRADFETGGLCLLEGSHK